MVKYLESGYLTASFRETVASEKKAPHSLTVTYEIQEGPRVIISSVVTLGRVETRQRLIDRAVMLTPHQPLAASKMLSAESRLYSPAIFDWAEVVPRRQITTQSTEAHAQRETPSSVPRKATPAPAMPRNTPIGTFARPAASTRREDRDAERRPPGEGDPGNRPQMWRPGPDHDYRRRNRRCRDGKMGALQDRGGPWKPWLIATRRPRTTHPATRSPPNKRRTLGTHNLPTQGGVLVGSYATVARLLDELSEVPGVQGVMRAFGHVLPGASLSYC